QIFFHIQSFFLITRIFLSKSLPFLSSVTVESMEEQSSAIIISYPHSLIQSANKPTKSGNKLREFSDIPQDNPPTNNSTDIPIFNVPEIVSPQPEKETSEHIV